MIRRLPPILRNRYALVAMIFVVYIGFFDAHDMISQMKIKMKINRLNSQIEYLEKDSREAEMRIKELTTDHQALEKFARETYRMKRENEDIFVIITDGQE